MPEAVEPETKRASQSAVADALPAANTMLIGEVAALTGLTQRTLRYYEEIGLLPPASRLEGGFRLYTVDDVDRLRRITELKKVLGFSLVEIKDMVELEDERRVHRQASRREAGPEARGEHITLALAAAREQLVRLESRLASLLALRDKTHRRIERYEAELASLGQTHRPQERR